jgi:anti-sigma factor RsiW
MEKSPMSSCDTVKDFLSAYMEDVLDPEAKSKIQSHLEGCPACRQAYANLQFLTQKLRNVSPVAVSEEFDQKLRSKIINERREQEPVISIRNLSYGLSGAVVLACVYFFFMTDPFTPANMSVEPQPPVKISSSPKSPNPGAVSVSKQTSLAKEESSKLKQPMEIDTLRDKSTNIDQDKIILVDQ